MLARVAVQRATEAKRLPRGRHGLLPGAVVENQRQRLIRAVPAAVREKGFVGMTVEDLAGRAGVSRKTFYENFHDKRDCFLAAYRQAAQELAAVVSSAAAAGTEWPEQVSSALAALLRFFAARPDVASMGVIEVMAAGPEALAERDAAVAGLAALLGDDALAAAPKPAPRLLLETIAGGISQLIYATVLAGRTQALEELLPTIMYMVLVPMHGPLGAADRARLVPEITPPE
jgi:AcrR family transcriptional regulator